MNRQQEEQFRDFTLARWPTLLRTAALLSPDQPRAELLVRRTLVHLHRDWEHSDRRAAPEAWARSVLVRLSLDQPVGHPYGQAREARPSDRSERLAAAVVALPPRVRAALVLRLLDDLSEGDTARVLRCPAPEVAALVGEGLGRLEGAPSACTVDSPLAGDVRRAMQWRADQLETTPDPQALVEQGLREDRRRRRVVRTRVVAALVSLALAGLLVDALRPNPPAPDPAARVAAGPAASGALGTWAVRGSLSGSIATLAEATRRLSREDLTVDRLLYAGDVGPDRLVLALVDPPGRERRDPEDIAPAADSADHPQRDVVALFGRAGAPVDSLAQDDPSRVLADATVLTWSHQQRSAAPLLVLTGSATRSARLSDEPVYDNGGGLTRTWRTVPLVNGVWAGRTGPKGPALARVQVGGYDGGVEIRGGTEPDPDDEIYDYASADYRLVSLVSDFARSHQVAAEDIDPHVLYDGGTGEGTFLVVALHLPDGTAFQTALMENRFPDGTSYTTYPVQGRPVAAADADQHPVVYVEASADDAGSSPVRVVAPGAALVRIVGGVLPGSPPSVMAEIRVNGAGYGTRNLPGSLVWQTQGWQVVSLDADGHELGRWPLVGQHDEDPLDVLPR